MTILNQQENIQIKVRLVAIDAPEKAQAFGQKSKQAIIKIVDTDRYGRTVGEVTCSGTNANEVMVRSGFAWVYRKYAKGYGHLYALEKEAEISSFGLWADPSPMPPWEWRKVKRGQ